jgi:hypothetical protein
MSSNSLLRCKSQKKTVKKKSELQVSDLAESDKKSPRELILLRKIWQGCQSLYINRRYTLCVSQGEWLCRETVN